MKTEKKLRVDVRISKRGMLWQQHWLTESEVIVFCEQHPRGYISVYEKVGKRMKKRIDLCHVPK